MSDVKVKVHFDEDMLNDLRVETRGEFDLKGNSEEQACEFALKYLDGLCRITGADLNTLLTLIGERLA